MLWRSFVNINIFYFDIIPPSSFLRSLPPPSTSPFFAGGPTRVTASTFQPFNPRYRSPNSRATTAANLNRRQSTTPSVTNRNLPNVANRNLPNVANRNLPNAANRPSRR